MPELAFDDFLKVDDNLICTEEITNDDIVCNIINENCDDLTDEEMENEHSRPSVKQASEWLLLYIIYIV